MSKAVRLEADLVKVYARIIPYLRHARLHVGTALRSPEAFVEVYDSIASDEKDQAKIKIAEDLETDESRLTFQLWMGWFGMKELGFEVVRVKSRGEYGHQHSRFAFASVSELLSYDGDKLEGFFLGWPAV